MNDHAHDHAVPQGRGLTIHGAARYDLLVGLLTLGGERRLREKILDLAKLRSGERVLDIGCGTGSLAILAARRVGSPGRVHGLDLSADMLAHAAIKAKRAGVDLTLAHGAAQALSYPDAAFDVVLSTFMLHHVPETARRAMALEIRRVLKPSGRALLVDFGPPKTARRSVIDHVHPHGFIQIDEIAADLDRAGLKTLSGPVGEKGLQFILAGTDESLAAHGRPGAYGASRGHTTAGVILGALALSALIAAHIGAALSLWRLPHALSPKLSAVVIGALVVLVLAKLTLFSVAHRFAGKLFGRWVRAGHSAAPEA